MGDARTGKRFPVQLPIRIHVGDSEVEQAGTTANVSSSGVYITAEEASLRKRAAKGGKPAKAAKTAKTTKTKDKDKNGWRPGSEVEFEMTLPAKVIGAKKDVQVLCRGRVVRVEKVKGSRSKSGVACVIDKYEFVRKS